MCRSQMAEGWTKVLKGKEYLVFSAGVKPGKIDPLTIRVMAEAGVDISSQYSKSTEELEGIVFDYVITVCDNARENCPFFPAIIKLVHYGFDDPPYLARDAKTEAEALKHYRRVRDEIKQFIENKLESVLDIKNQEYFTTRK
jgi:arsenate reductase